MNPSEPRTIGSIGWRRFCVWATDIFYDRNEVTGLEHLPAEGPVLLAANHVNALADAVVVQFACPRSVHPVARAGLFRNPLLRPILRFIQAVPIQRRQPGTENVREQNEAAFARLYEYLEEGRVILIFPEGQSHSDPRLRPIKTGVARLALGHRQRTGETPTVVPVGLTFTQKGRFRADVLVCFGEPVPFVERPGESEETAVRRYTDEILGGLRRVILEVDSWEDLALVRLMQEFFTLRGNRERRSGSPPRAAKKENTLARRFRAYRRLLDAHRVLRVGWPERVALLREKLRHFYDLRRRYGVRGYQLELRYTPGVVARFAARSLAFLLFVFPLALWGLVHSALPWLATRAAQGVTARGRDQYDTAGMLFGTVFFALFWGAQTAAVAWRFGLGWASAYALSLPITAGVALAVGRERRRLLEEVRVFFLFLRRRELRDYLRERREELEVELAHMARLARRAREEIGPTLDVPPAATSPVQSAH